MKYIITGASSGIGRRCAERLLEEGNECLLLARSKDRLDEMSCKYEFAKSYTIDLTVIESIEDVFNSNSSMFPFDGLIHCAGIAPLKRTDENDYVTLRTAYETNVFSFIELMRCMTQIGVLKDGGAVVAMSSVIAHRGSNRQSIYSGTKAALEGTIRCMAKELIDRRIRVNAVVSGTVETEMLKKLRTESPNLDEKIMRHSPLGIVPVDDICEIIEFLLSDKASHITGASVPVDSGFLL